MSHASIAVYLFGILWILPHAALLLAPEKTLDLLRRFPRARIPGAILSIVATLWFAFLLNDNIPFEMLRPARPFLVMIAAGMCIPMILYMDDLLSVRALGCVLLLAGVPMLEAIYLKAYPYTWPITIGVYFLMVVAMLFVLNPWTFRRWVNRFWVPKGIRGMLVLLNIAFGLLCIAIGAMYL